MSNPPLEIRYRNHRGETALRRITPKGVYYGATKWHPEPQWLLSAWDHDKQEARDFALADINPHQGESGLLLLLSMALGAIVGLLAVIWRLI